MSNELEDVIGIYKKLTLNGETINHHELTLNDLVELKGYIKDLIEAQFKENLKIGKEIEDEVDV